MNFYRSNRLAIIIRSLCAGLALLIFCGVSQAQTGSPGRWLLVFDTSTTMKKRLPATTAALQHFLESGADGQLDKNDSMAVWTYGKQLSAGQFPLVAWEPDQSAVVSSNLAAFLRRQRYTNDSSFAPLTAPLNRVITGSERLTIVIFCDGLTEMNFTPYDDGINQNFRDGLSERKKSQQPFVVVLRSQLGKLVGCTVSFPPANINLPPFPALPKPANVSNTTSSPAAAATTPAVPDLVIIGTKVGTNLNAVAADAAATPKTVTPTPVAPVAVATNAPPTNPPVIAPPTAPLPAKAAATSSPPPTTNIMPALVIIGTPTPPRTNVAPIIKPVVTQVVAATVVPAVTQAPPPAVAPVITTNTTPATAAPVESDSRARLLIIVGTILLVVAAGLIIVLVRAGRRPHASLITSSMQDEPRRK